METCQKVCIKQQLMKLLNGLAQGLLDAQLSPDG